MGTRTVRLDQEEERLLAETMRRTGRNASAVLKDGLRGEHEKLERRPTAWEIYSRMDLGAGGYARAPAADAKRAVKAILRRKHERERARNR
jgi:hypothetical protein